jgi:hypothetical protein
LRQALTFFKKKSGSKKLRTRKSDKKNRPFCPKKAKNGKKEPTPFSENRKKEPSPFSDFGAGDGG